MKTSRGRKWEDGPDAGKSTSGLSGWAGIEDTAATDDEGKMKGYSEDIDTLLVFAGLFSAILTAFVVSTYTMLQPSSADLTNQLLTTNNQILAQNSQILIQGFSAVITGAPFSPPQLMSLDDPPPFEPSTPARWINTLFFISLILSLAAALLGILVKQWVREYMQWNSPLATPRANIMVRQFRFEAWEAWNVSAVVSTVPALLEIAMILFLIGMIILLWTLDDIAAICVTAVAAMFLLVVAVFTVLPVFSRRCPYKSPTAWAVMAACKIMAHSATICINWASTPLLYRRWCRFIKVSRILSTDIPIWAYTILIFPVLFVFIAIVLIGMEDDLLERRKRIEWEQLPLSWRDVDLVTCRTMLPRFGSWQLRHETMRAAGEKACSAETPDGPERKATMDELSVEVKETILLMRAMSWVAKSSQNSHVVTYIKQCYIVEQDSRERTLDFLLHVAAQIYREARSARPGLVSEVRRPLLQFVLDHSEHENTSVLVQRTCTDALRDQRITFSVADKRLALEQAHTTAADCELLLANYIPPEFSHADRDLLEMFITTSIEWLTRSNMRLASSVVVVGALEKIIKAVDVWSVDSAVPLDTAAGVSQGDSGVEVRGDHREWIRQLYQQKETLTEKYGALYRQLWHALEKAYKRHKLRGDQDCIRAQLHNALETSHNRQYHLYQSSTCEVDDCPWTGHGSWYAGRHYAECNLLPKIIRLARPPGLLPLQPAGLAALSNLPDEPAGSGHTIFQEGSSTLVIQSSEDRRPGPSSLRWPLETQGGTPSEGRGVGEDKSGGVGEGEGKGKSRGESEGRGQGSSVHEQANRGVKSPEARHG